MTFTTVHSSRGQRGRRSGFTLVEVMIALSLGVIVLGIATGSLVFLARSSVAAGNYQNMGISGRKALEYFASDARMTDDVVGIAVFSGTKRAYSTVLSVYNASKTTEEISYVYNQSAGTFMRYDASGTGTVLLNGVQRLFLTFYDINGNETVDPLAAKEVQLSAKMERKALALDNTDEIISARFMMRNRVVSGG